MKTKLTRADYPLAEKAPDRIQGGRGRALDDLTMEGVLAGEITIEDMRITSDALKAQAEIARTAGRPTLAANFERGAELVAVPQDLIMETYEMLRPGRVREWQVLQDRAEMFRRDYDAEEIARFIETAAEMYRRRGLVPG